jgi:hypothetical protein
MGKIFEAPTVYLSGSLMALWELWRDSVTTYCTGWNFLRWLFYYCDFSGFVRHLLGAEVGFWDRKCFRGKLV